jgi:hypothetical protein
MSLSKGELSFYVDTMVVETLLLDNHLSKTAQAGSIVSGLIEKVTHYVNNHIDPNDKVGSLLNILAPGALSVAFSAMGLGWLGILFGLALKVFNIDVKGILSSIYDKVKSMISGGKQVSSTEVDDAVQSSVQEHVTPATEEEAGQAMQLLDRKKSSQLLRDARMLKLAMVAYHQAEMKKQALPSFLSMFSSRKSTTANILTKVLGWIFKIALASAGFMVAGDVINKFLGRPNALDDTIQKGRPVGQSESGTTTEAPALTLPVSHQTKFPMNPGFRSEVRNTGSSNWVESVANDRPSIESMLVQFAKDVYQGLNGKESIIRSTPGFRAIADKITFYNHQAEGNPMVFIPRYFKSKKQIVDYFIDDVAQKAS